MGRIAKDCGGQNNTAKLGTKIRLNTGCFPQTKKISILQKEKKRKYGDPKKTPRGRKEKEGVKGWRLELPKKKRR